VFITLSSIKADPLNSENAPGAQSTQPRTCSAAFCSQWEMAYSNLWYHTMGPTWQNDHRYAIEEKRL